MSASAYFSSVGGEIGPGYSEFLHARFSAQRNRESARHAQHPRRPGSRDRRRHASVRRDTRAVATAIRTHRNQIGVPLVHGQPIRQRARLQLRAQRNQLRRAHLGSTQRGRPRATRRARSSSRAPAGRAGRTRRARPAAPGRRRSSSASGTGCRTDSGRSRGPSAGAATRAPISMPWDSPSTSCWRCDRRSTHQTETG